MRSTRLTPLFLLTGLLLATSASATPIPIGTTVADDLIINIDFSSATPPPPYASITVNGSFTGLDPGETLSIDLFGGLNGTDFLLQTGSVTAGSPEVGGPFGLFTTFQVALLDGQFSWGFRITGGAADLSSLVATGGLADGRTATINGLGATSTAVPEPASLILLGTGLVGAGVRRYRQRR